MKTTFKPFRQTKSDPPKANTPKKQKQKDLKLSNTSYDNFKEAVRNQLFKKSRGLA
jgi:hypothetical protein